MSNKYKILTNSQIVLVITFFSEKSSPKKNKFLIRKKKATTHPAITKIL